MAAGHGSVGAVQHMMTADDVIARAAELDWSSYTRIQHNNQNVFITENDVAIMKNFDGCDGAAIAELLATDEEAVEYVKVLMKLLNAVSDKRAVQYALTVIERCVFAIMNPASPDDDTVQGIHAFREDPCDHGSRMHTTPVVKALKRAEAEGDLYSVECAATAAARLVAADSSSTPAAGELLSWAKESLSTYRDVEAGTDAARAAEASVSALMIMLRHSTVREYFVSDASGVKNLLPLLASKDTQLVYEAANCLWKLTFSASGRRCILAADGIHALCDIIRLDLPVKIVRMGVSCLASIAQHFQEDSAGQELPEPMPLIGESRVPDVLQDVMREAAKAEKFKDPEMLEAADYLLQCISYSRRSMTSIARYRAQLSTGVLRPGALHSSEFWQENVHAFEGDDWSLIKQLKGILDNPSSTHETLSLALGDCAEFAVYHPNGRSVLVGLHLKDSTMELVTHDSQDVKHAALLTLSRLMLARWDFVDGAARR